MIFWVVFRLFLKNYNTDFVQTWSECSLHRARAFAKNRTSKSFPVLELFILKVGIFGQNGYNGVQRSAHISRTAYATKNLIRYSETRRNFLSRSSDQIFHSSSSSGCNFDLKTANFDLKNRRFWGVFEDFQPEYLSTWAQTSHGGSSHTSGEDAENCRSKLLVLLAKFDVKNCQNRKIAS